jgi:hypothetical protein
MGRVKRQGLKNGEGREQGYATDKTSDGSQ